MTVWEGASRAEEQQQNVVEKKRKETAGNSSTDFRTLRKANRKRLQWRDPSGDEFGSIVGSK